MRKNPKLFLLQVRKTLVDKTCGKIDRMLCMTYNLFYYIGRSYTDHHPRIASSSCRAKSWELNYPALSFILNGGYYADYASIMGTMGLSTMYHSTWDNLVSWVGPHVDRLANWSCEQVRADIEKHGDRSQ